MKRMKKIIVTLGLAHNAKGDVMYAYVSSVTSLSANDKASYDASYKRY